MSTVQYTLPDVHLQSISTRIKQIFIQFKISVLMLRIRQVALTFVWIVYEQYLDHRCLYSQLTHSVWCFILIYGPGSVSGVVAQSVGTQCTVIMTVHIYLFIYFNLGFKFRIISLIVPGFSVPIILRLQIRKTQILTRFAMFCRVCF